MKLLRTFGAISAVLFGLGAGSASADPVRLAITDLAGLERLQAEFGKFKEVLTEATGLEYVFYPVTSRTAAVEALSAQKVDFVLTGPAEYVVMRKRTDAQPVVGFSRPDYFSAVIVMADSGIDAVMDLKGKTVALGDIGSTSNHLAPMQVMADYGLKPAEDVKVMHIGANVAWEALKKGDVAAIGMNYGKFVGIRGKETEFEPGAFRVIGRGPDLPNDVLMAGTHVDPQIVEKVRGAFISHDKQLVEAILVGDDNQKYLGMKFLPNITDAEYDYVRSMYTTIGQPEYAEFVSN
jgi:phosphonate transport system substrate-binding protein